MQMRIGLAQMDIRWENIKHNMTKAEHFFREAAAEKVDLLVFPEMTLTGFSMNVEVTGKRWKEQVGFFRGMSREYDVPAVFGYSMPVSDRLLEEHPDWNHYHNRLGFVEKGELLMSYAKIHPFTYGLEGKYYQGGRQLQTLQWKGIGVGAFICYDLRFPEIFQIVSDDCELILVIANWPGSRVHHWDCLLKARAMENQCIVAGVNRTGEGDGIVYNGHSAVYGPDGECYSEVCEEEKLVIADVDPSLMQGIRENFPLKVDRLEEFYVDLWQEKRKMKKNRR